MDHLVCACCKRNVFIVRFIFPVDGNLLILLWLFFCVSWEFIFLNFFFFGEKFIGIRVAATNLSLFRYIYAKNHIPHRLAERTKIEFEQKNKIKIFPDRASCSAKYFSSYHRFFSMNSIHSNLNIFLLFAGISVIFPTNFAADLHQNWEKKVQKKKTNDR